MSDPTPVGEVAERIRKELGLPEMTPEAQARADAEEVEAERRAQVQVRLASVPKKFADASAIGFAPEIVHQMRLFVQNPHVSGGLIFHGPTGVGKTHLLWGIYRGLANRLGPGMRIVNVVDALESMKPSSGDDPHGQMLRLLQAPVLGLDDLGVEGEHTVWERKQLYQLVNGRYQEERPMVITTNVHPDEMKNVVGDRVASRLAEACTQVIITGSDRRYG